MGFCNSTHSIDESHNDVDTTDTVLIPLEQNQNNKEVILQLCEKCECDNLYTTLEIIRSNTKHKKMLFLITKIIFTMCAKYY